MTAHRLLLAAVIGCAIGCSRGDPSDLVVSRIRLVDRLAEARFESVADPAHRESLVQVTTRVLAFARGIETADLPWIRFEVDASALASGVLSGTGPIARRVAPGLRASAMGAHVPGASVTLMRVDTIGDRDHIVEVGFAPDAEDPGGTRDGIVVFELERTPAGAAPEIADEASLIAMFANDASAHRFPDRVGGTIEFRTAPGTAAIAVAILSLRGGAIDHLRVSRRTRLGGLLEHPIAIAGDPRAQRVLIGDERRESLVLAAPGNIVFESKLKRGASRLRAAIAPIDWLADESSAPTVRVEVVGDRSRRGAEVTLAPETWKEIEIDLSLLAGEDVRIEFSCDGRADGSAIGVAIGTPSIDVVPENSRPDVLLISLDTLRYDRTTLAGYPVPTTPRLHELGATAGVFARAFAPAAYTLPSHATIFSGRLPDAHGVNASNSRYDAADDALLAVAFRAAGYATAGFTAGGYVRPEFGLARGFEIYRIDDPGRPEWREQDGPYTDLTNESLRGLERFLAQERAVPAFVFVHTYAAHDYWAPRALAMRLGIAEEHEWDSLEAGTMLELRERARSGAIDDDLRRRLSRHYDAGARLADETLGRVLDLFEASGRLENALVVVVSDHGEELLERGRIGHGFSAYDEMLRVPFLMRGPGIAPGEYDTIVSLADVAPTIRAYAGIEEPSHSVDGRSLLPLLRGDTLPADAAYVRILGEGEAAERALRGDRHKLRVVGDPYRPSEVVLHDLRGDPGETRNAADRSPEVTAAMLDALRRLYREQVERPRVPIESVMSADTIRQLRELGYLDANR